MRKRESVMEKVNRDTNKIKLRAKGEGKGMKAAYREDFSRVL